MRILRELLLPALISTPIWVMAMPLPIRGWSAFTDPNVSAADFVAGLVLTTVGILLIGLPAASLVARRNWPMGAKTAALFGFGAGGGGLVAILYVLLLSLGGGGDFDLESVKALPALALFGVLPGVIVAFFWTILNFDKLRKLPEKVDA